jgi:hypothetical protein
LMARLWWFLGQACLVRARRHELRAGVLKKKAEEFFQRIARHQGGRDEH